MSRRRRAAAGALAIGLLLGACADGGSSPREPGGTTGAGGSPATLRRALDGVHSFALALGVDPGEQEVADRLGRYDLVVVDGEVDPEQVAALQADGARVLGYLSVGTLEPGRPWFPEAEDGGWLLDHWDDWDEWYAAVDQPGLRDLLLEQAASILDRGFDGLFLDNVDMVEGHPDQAEGMVQLVADLDDLVGSERALMSQNGDASIDRFVDHLDGWNREDVSSTFDFDADAYAAVPTEDHASATATLRRLHERGLLVTATDYAPSDDDPLVAGSVDGACAVGAVPFTSDIDLTRLPDPPLRCR